MKIWQITIFKKKLFENYCRPSFSDRPRPSDPARRRLNRSRSFPNQKNPHHLGIWRRGRRHRRCRCPTGQDDPRRHLTPRRAPPPPPRPPSPPPVPGLSPPPRSLHPPRQAVLPHSVARGIRRRGPPTRPLRALPRPREPAAAAGGATAPPAREPARLQARRSAQPRQLPGGAPRRLLRPGVRRQGCAAAPRRPESRFPRPLTRRYPPSRRSISSSKLECSSGSVFSSIWNSVSFYLTTKVECFLHTQCSEVL